MSNLIPYNAVDLSKLAPPTIVEKLAYDEVFSELMREFVGRDPTYTILLESDPAVKLLEVGAFREQILRHDFNDRALQLLLAYATGVNLEHLGALFGIERATLQKEDRTVFPALPLIMEDDTRLRQRIQFAPETFSVAGPAGAYIGHALNADGHVRDVDAFSPSPGVAIITLLSDADDGFASDALCETVYDYLYPRRPMTDYVQVKSGSVIRYKIDAVLDVDPGPDKGIVRRQAVQSIAAYVKARFKLGVKVTRSGVEAALTVGGVSEVILTDFPEHIIPPHDQAALCTSISVYAP